MECESHDLLHRFLVAYGKNSEEALAWINKCGEESKLSFLLREVIFPENGDLQSVAVALLRRELVRLVKQQENPCDGAYVCDVRDGFQNTIGARMPLLDALSHYGVASNMLDIFRNESNEAVQRQVIPTIVLLAEIHISHGIEWNALWNLVRYLLHPTPRAPPSRAVAKDRVVSVLELLTSLAQNPTTLLFLSSHLGEFLPSLFLLIKPITNLHHARGLLLLMLGFFDGLTDVLAHKENTHYSSNRLQLEKTSVLERLETFKTTFKVLTLSIVQFLRTQRKIISNTSTHMVGILRRIPGDTIKNTTQHTRRNLTEETTHNATAGHVASNMMNADVDTTTKTILDPMAYGMVDVTTNLTIDFTLDRTADTTTHSILDSTVDLTKDPILDSTVDPTKDPILDSTVDLTKDPILDSTVDPTKDPILDSTVDLTKDPILDATVDLTKDPTRVRSIESSIDGTRDPTRDCSIENSIDGTTDTIRESAVNVTLDTLANTIADRVASTAEGSTANITAVKNVDMTADTVGYMTSDNIVEVIVDITADTSSYADSDTNSDVTSNLHSDSISDAIVDSLPKIAEDISGEIIQSSTAETIEDDGVDIHENTYTTHLFIDVLSLLVFLLENDLQLLIDSQKESLLLSMTLIENESSCKEIIEYGARLFFISINMLIMKNKNNQVKDLQEEHAEEGVLSESFVQFLDCLLTNKTVVAAVNEERVPHLHEHHLLWRDLTASDVLESCVHMLGDFLVDYGSEALSKEIIKHAIFAPLSCKLPFQNSMKIGARVTCAIVDGRPEILRPMLVDLFQFVLNALQRIKESTDASTMLWVVRAYSAVIHVFGEEVLRFVLLQSALSPLVSLLEAQQKLELYRDSSQHIYRAARYESLKVVYELVVLLNDKPLDIPYVNTTLALVVDSVVVPELQGRQAELSPVVLQLVGALKQISVEMSIDNTSLFQWIHRICISTPLRYEGTDVRHSFTELHHAAIDLGVQLCCTTGDLRWSQWMLSYLTERLQRTHETLIENCSWKNSYGAPQHVLASLVKDFSHLTQAIATIAGKSTECFRKHCGSVLRCLGVVLTFSHGVLLNVQTSDATPHTEELPAEVVQKVTKSFHEKKWDHLVVDNGVTQLILRGEQEEQDYVFQLNSSIISIKVDALKCLKKLFDELGNDVVPHIVQMIPFILREAVSPSVLLYEAALDALRSVLPCFLPSYEEHRRGVHFQDSRCALRQPEISMDVWLCMAESLISPLIHYNTRIVTQTRCCGYVMAVQDILEAFKEGVSLKMYQQSGVFGHECHGPLTFSEDALPWLRSIFNFYRYFIIKTLRLELQDRGTDVKLADIHHDEQCDLSWSESLDVSTCFDCCDQQGLIYFSIMRGIVALAKVFREPCTRLFLEYLSTPYTVLLTLPESNMKGRVAALLVYGELLRHCVPIDAQRIAETLLPLCLLYVRSNKMTEERILEPMLRHASQHVVSQVQRIEAAAHTIGIISLTTRSIFPQHIELTLTLLHHIVNLAESDVTDRDQAKDSCAATLLMIYLNPAYTTFCTPLITSVQGVHNSFYTLLGLLESRFPLTASETASCSSVDHLVKLLLEPQTHDGAYFLSLLQHPVVGMPLTSHIKRVFHLIQQRFSKKSPLGLNRETMASGLFARACDAL